MHSTECATNLKVEGKEDACIGNEAGGAVDAAAEER